MDQEYEAEIVLHLLPIAIPNLDESKDLKENDDFCLFFSYSLPVSYLKCDNKYQAEIVLHLLPNAISNLAQIQGFEGK